MHINGEQELRDLARAIHVEADAATDPENKARLRALALGYERRAARRRSDRTHPSCVEGEQGIEIAGDLQ